MKRVFTGIKATGDHLHLGNYFGTIVPFREHTQGNDAMIWVADLHSLTSVHDSGKLGANFHNIATELCAIFDDEAITIFRQSDIRQLPLLHWILSTITPHSLMLRAHAFKDAQAKGSDLNMGVFTYPILMAADILGYDIEQVPVGKDQTQHIEFTRDIAEAFHRAYDREVFTMPEGVYGDMPTLPGLDGRKMSKSYDNFVSFFEDEETIRKKVMSIVTDSKGVDEPKNPDECSVFAFIRLFGTEEEIVSIAQKYRTGGYGYGHAKLALYDMIMRYSVAYRTRRDELLKKPDIVRDRLDRGADLMNARMDEVMERVRDATGL